MEIVNLSGVQFLQSEKLKGVLHGFSLRNGGVSEGEFSSLNIGLRRGDNPFSAIKNIEIALGALNMQKENVTLTYQTHTSFVAFVTENDIGKGFIKEWGQGVDAVVTNLKNVPLVCYSADCVPTLLYHEKAGLIGAVHGGWRGTAAKILENAISLMKEHGADSEGIVAFSGPCIGKCCYEVDSDVADAFKEYPGAVFDKGNGKYMLDLKSVTKAQLLSCGLKEENIDISPFCTVCDNDKFFSHRAQKGKSGLLGGFIQMI